MKVLDKFHIRKRNQEGNTKDEKNILASINYPFIVKMFFSFQSSTKLYLVVEYCQGGELFYHLRRNKTFSVEKSKFYIAEILLALNHLHEKNIIYRDLKPENVLLHVNGHIKIADFGLSKYDLDRIFVINSANTKTYTFCGTPEYLAPEIIKGKGYNHSIDIWSLGALFYDMVYGKPPFYKKTREDMYYAILEGKLEFPPNENISAEIKDLISKILIVEPLKRLGCGKYKMDEIKSHQGYWDFDWEKCEKSEIEPPFVPQVVSVTDVRHFDRYFTREIIAASQEEQDKESTGGLNFSGYSFYRKTGEIEPGPDESQEGNN